MKRKMIYSFSVPVILICITINALCYLVFYQNYEKQLRYTVNQSSVQADNFISNYIMNMYNIAQLMADNGELNNILSSDSFNTEKKPDEYYREYYALNNAFCNIEIANPSYRIGLYIPDNLIYSNNNYYFYPESSLQERDDYEKLMDVVETRKMYFAVINEEKSSHPSQIESYIALFQAIHVKTESGDNTYVTKVEVLLSNLEKVLLNAKSTEKGLVYLLDESGNLLAASDEKEYRTLTESYKLPDNKVDSWNELRLGNKSYYVVYQKINGYNWQIFSLVPIEEYKEQSRFIWWMLVSIIILLGGAIYWISYLLSNYYVNRLANLNQKMKSLESGNLNTILATQSGQTGDEIDEIYMSFNYMTGELRRLMIEHYKLGKNIMSAELKALQAQINPHFLYNTLDLINWGALNHGADEVAQIAINLGQFYRLSLNHGRTAIRIDDELKHVEAYVNIENVHFAGAVNLEIDVSEEIREFACLNIILQPFVENSIMHGIAEYPDIIECNITISAFKEGEDILFTICDDGPGIEQERLSCILDEITPNFNNGYGVKNINFRLKLCYGDKYGVSYESMPDEGTTVYIRIPAMTLEQLEESLL